MKESAFQKKFIRELKVKFPGCIVLKNDASYIQGIPDLLMLYKNKWAAFEIKKNKNASHQPNQDYYILKLDKMSFARFVYPENKVEVLNDLARAFKTSRITRFPVTKQSGLAKVRQGKDNNSKAS